ncbi:hypothetical protein E0504_17115 [Parafrankia sp. BMG5.11]|nr:hypothetical protein E0504_17115 [Parafrankia sp. BMG5.11]
MTVQSAGSRAAPNGRKLIAGRARYLGVGMAESAGSACLGRCVTGRPSHTGRPAASRPGWRCSNGCSNAGEQPRTSAAFHGRKRTSTDVEMTVSSA